MIKLCFKKILNACIVLAVLIVIINNSIISSVWNGTKQTKESFEDNLDISKTEFCNISTIKMFDNRIYCLNDVSRMIIVLSKTGNIEKLIQLPYKNDPGASRIYLMYGCLCIKDVNGNLYQYSSINEFQKITLKGDKIRIYDKKGRMIKEREVQREYDEIMFYSEDFYTVFYTYDIQSLDIYSKDSLLKRQKIDYEELTKDQKEIKDNKITYKIGKLKNKLIKTEGNKRTILYKSTWQNFLFHSSIVSSFMIIFIVLLSFINWIILKI
jgi:hypothetical protein